MESTLSQLKKQQRNLVQGAVETFITSAWSTHLNVSQSFLEKTFSGIFSNLWKELQQQTLLDWKKNLAEYFISTFKQHHQLRNNFDAQLAIIGIARSVINHYFIHTAPTSSHEGIELFHDIQKIFDETLIFLSHWWNDIHNELRKEDLKLIEQLKTVKDGLQRHLNFIYQILRESPVAIAGCDKHLDIHFWNPMATQLTLFAPSEILQKNLFTIFPETVKERIEAKLSKENKHYFRLQGFIRRKDNTQFPAFLSFSNVRSTQISNFQYIVSFIDISEQIHFRNTQKHLQQLMAISQLSSAIMHDIRNPIHALGLNLELLSEKLQELNGNSQSPVQEIINRLQREVGMLNQHLEQYLTYSQLPFREFELFDFAEKLKELYQEIAFDLQQKKIRFKYEILAPSPCWVNGDWYQLQRVILNIIQNAIDVLEPEKGFIHSTLSRKRNRIYLTIADNGPGIPENVRTQVFEAFYTTKSSGSGLGLFISRQIIKAHKGRLYFKSKLEKGTQFIISLPSMVK